MTCAPKTEPVKDCGNLQEGMFLQSEFHCTHVTHLRVLFWGSTFDETLCFNFDLVVLLLVSWTDFKPITNFSRR